MLATQRLTGISSSNEASHQGGPTQGELEVDVLLEICTDGMKADVIGHLEGGGWSRKLLLDGQRQQRTDAVCRPTNLISADLTGNDGEREPKQKGLYQSCISGPR